MEVWRAGLKGSGRHPRRESKALKAVAVSRKGYARERQEGSGPERGTAACEDMPRRVKPMDAPALRAPVGSAVDAAKGVFKPRTWHAGTEGSVLTTSGSADPRLCRRARKLRNGCIVRGPQGPAGRCGSLSMVL